MLSLASLPLRPKQSTQNESFNTQLDHHVTPLLKAFQQLPRPYIIPLPLPAKLSDFISYFPPLCSNSATLAPCYTLDTPGILLTYGLCTECTVCLMYLHGPVYLISQLCSDVTFTIKTSHTFLPSRQYSNPHHALLFQLLTLLITFIFYHPSASRPTSYHQNLSSMRVSQVPRLVPGKQKVLSKILLNDVDINTDRLVQVGDVKKRYF